MNQIKQVKNNNCKKGFKYKVNHLYDELIKKDKIKEQNIILQAIRYLVNLKDEEKIMEQCDDTPSIKKRISFDKISDFQACNSLYPCIFSTHYKELSE